MWVDDHELDLDEDMRIHNGSPFTGISCAFHWNGLIRSERRYVDGFGQGLCREWYENGQLMFEENLASGMVHGNVVEWHESGRVKFAGNYRLGVGLAGFEWNEEGRLVKHFKLDPQSELWKYAFSRNP